MKYLIILISICFTLGSSGQTFYFPKEYYKDSISLGKNMSALAKKILANYKNTNKKDYFDNLYRFQILAEQFADAIKSIDSFHLLLRESDPLDKSIDGIYFQFQTFCYSKLRQSRRITSFNDAFDSTFTRMFTSLPDEAALKATTFFNFDISQIHDYFYSLLKKQDGKDSINLSDAEMVCSIYNLLYVNSLVQPLAKSLITDLEARKKYIIQDSVLIKTRDGSIISATVVRIKDGLTKLPAIFIFNIYSNSQDDRSMAIEAASKGFVGVVADTRGKRLSPQEIEPFEHDATDAYDIIDWISNQTWSNGKVGMYGGSYLGFTQWAAVKNIHPALKTIIPQAAVGIGIDYPMLNNVFMSYMLRWIHQVSNQKETDYKDFNNEEYWNSIYKKWYASGRSFRSLDSIEGRPNVIFQRWLSHPSYDVYWQNMIPYKGDFSTIKIPILTITGVL